jgi:hypothetical protein
MLKALGSMPRTARKQIKMEKNLKIFIHLK